MRLILDTNLWISFLISSDFQKLDTILLSEDTTLLFSRELLDEFIEVANRPKLRKYISVTELAEIQLIFMLDEVVEFVDVQSDIQKCCDPKDNFLLSLAVDGKADYLLTGDKDLLVLEKIEETQIMTITDFFTEMDI